MPRPEWQRAVGRQVRSLRATTGRTLMRVPMIRRALNRAYLRGGRLQAVVIASFPSLRAATPFVWHVAVRGRTLLMPVLPDVPQSWNAAIGAWDWWGIAAHRRLYEQHLDTHPDGTFLDIGANHGTHTYPFALAGYRCLAFEPQAVCLDYIGRVCALNSLTVERIQAVVTDEPVDEVEFFVSDSTWFSSLSRRHIERFEPARAVRVPAVRLDAACQAHDARPTVIKIDVEGWEWPVLRSGVETLGKHRPLAVIEISSKNPDKPAIWRLFAELRYTCARLGDTGTVLDRDAFLADAGANADDYVFAPR